MTVSLTMKYQGAQEETRSVPVATQHLFEEYWIPASTRLGLKWVPIFQSGLPVDEGDIPDIVTELSLLKKYFTDRTDRTIPDEVMTHILGRIETLIRELMGVCDGFAVDIYIG